jgi:hypothetical protein
VSGANVTGTVANATFATTAGSATTAGTVTTAAQPNITSTGTLASLSVTGNVTSGNLVTSGILSVTGTGVSSIAGNLDMTSNNIVNLATPVNASDAATKQYVDDIAQGLHTHDSCNAATTGTLASISGGTVTYNNGTSGVGATLTTTGSYTTIDGVTLADGMRILVKNEVSTANNGIYVRTSATVLTRADDFDTPTEMAGGDFTFVTAGTVYDNTGWVMTDPVTTVGTSPVVWVQFSGAGTYTAGTGLTLTGSVFSVNVAQSQITSVGTLTSLSVSGNITAGNVSATTFTGALSGAATSATTAGTANSVAGANVTGTVANATFATTAGSANSVAGANVTGTVANATFATSAGSATTAGTVTTAAQPNITSVGTLTSLSVSGNVTGANVIVTNYNVRSVDAAVSAAGSTQGTATVLAKEFNRVSTVASGSGVVLPSAVAGMAITITNTSANSLLVYPASGAQINALAANVAFTQPTLGTIQFISLTGTQWYTVGGTYA